LNFKSKTNRNPIDKLEKPLDFQFFSQISKIIFIIKNRPFFSIFTGDQRFFVPEWQVQPQPQAGLRDRFSRKPTKSAH
jgi:hypothetical protein